MDEGAQHLVSTRMNTPLEQAFQSLIQKARKAAPDLVTDEYEEAARKPFFIGATECFFLIFGKHKASYEEIEAELKEWHRKRGTLVEGK